MCLCALAVHALEMRVQDLRVSIRDSIRSTSDSASAQSRRSMMMSHISRGKSALAMNRAGMQSLAMMYDQQGW
jgi:hypothetical protein